MSKKLSLCIMAAGMGSRYGGLKQIDPMGPQGEPVMAYSIYDAIRAGFDKIVFIIRRDFEEAFREAIVSKWEDKVEIACAFQSLDDLPDGFVVPEGREKPWGTAHALLAAEPVVDGAFAILNADDFYGAEAYQVMADFLRAQGMKNEGPVASAMVGYHLNKTLSDHGSVARGVCESDADGNLESVIELTKIVRTEAGAENREEGSLRSLSGEELVSMNFWGFAPGIFPFTREAFIEFLKTQGQEMKSEYYIPTVVDGLISSGRGFCRVLETDSEWFGVTYREDKPLVQESIRKLISDGTYPESLY
jgi:hypothetical protein